MKCKHCGQILATITWSDGPGWTHGRLAVPSYARECPEGSTYAEPEPPALVASEQSIPWPDEREYEKTLGEDETHD